MAGNVAGQKAQELTEHRVIFMVGGSASQHHLATGADAVVNLVALAQPQRAARFQVPWFGNGRSVWIRLRG